MDLLSSVTTLLLLLYIQKSGCTQNVTGYFLTFPAVLPAGSKEKFCMTLHGSTDLKISYRLTLTHQLTEIVEEFDLWTDEGGCIELAIPQTAGKYDLTLWELGGMNRVLEEIEVDIILGQTLITFVQTDKPMYKPGQKVKFRILSMKKDLAPRVGKIDEVFIKDPNDVRVKQWLNIDSDGLYSLDFQLADEPNLGTWTVEVTIDGVVTDQTFKVDEYVLPKFEVSIIPPKFMLANTSVVEGEICAKYTYGKTVKGHLMADVCLGGFRSSRTPCAKVNEEIDGCYKFKVNATDVGFRQGYYLYRAELQITAEVTEGGTGAMVKETSKGPKVEFDPLKITLKDDTNKFFKPSFPYSGQAIVTKPDGAPAPGEIIEITMIDYKNDIRLSRNYTTDKDGLIRFSTCTPVLPKTKQFRVEARAVEFTEDSRGPPTYRIYTPRSYSTIKQWFSPSRSYIQIPKINYTVACGEEITLDVPYTTTLNSFTLFHFQVMSKGRILHTGHKEHHFLKHDKTDMFDVSNELCLIEESVTTPQPNTATPPPQPRPVTGPADSFKTMIGKKMAEDGKEEVFEEPIIPKMFEPLGFSPLNSPIRKKRSYIPYHTDTEDIPVKMSDNPSTHISHVKIKFMVTTDMSADANLLVYYIRNDGETVADSVAINVESCFNNKVSMEFNEKEVLPGAETIMRLGAAPGSLCSVGVVDKSINILGGDHQITPEKLFAAIKSFSPSKPSSQTNNLKYCEEKLSESAKDKGESPERHSMFSYSSNYVDAIQAFQSMGLKVMTNMVVETRPCSKSYAIFYDVGFVDNRDFLPEGVMMSVPMMSRPNNRRRKQKKLRPKVKNNHIVLDVGTFVRNIFPETWLWSLERIGPMGIPMVAFSSARGSQQPGMPGAKMAENNILPSPKQNPSVQIRNVFPETWLWQLERVGDEGKLEVMNTAPHTITKWIGNTICSSTDAGFGFSPVTSLTTFQPFFLSFTLPYSAIRDERLPVRVTVFNYLDKCLLMKLNLEVWDDIEIVSNSDQNLDFCVCGGDSHTIQYKIIPRNIGKLSITARAEIVPGFCGNSLEMDTQYNGMKDAAERQILVKAEGVLQEYSLSKYICPNAGQDQQEDFDLPVPDDAVSDSARGEITVIGDIMGPALSNLDNLVSQPTGCGEQTMVTFTPNIYVLKYLESVDQNTEDMEVLAKHYMEIGYQRELTFRHKDGSFSAFGESDKSGSTWLTAFVVQSFAQAQQYIYIDKKDLQKSIDFLKFNQLENGCYKEVGKVFSSYMMGGLGKGDKSDLSPLTAYVIISLIEANVSKTDPMLLEAIWCLNKQHPSDDIYTMAIVAYANVMYNDSSDSSYEAMMRLNNKVIKDGSVQHWGRTSAKPKPVNGWYHFSAPSAEVEMTSYAMLARMVYTQNIGDVVPVAMWLSQQRNAFGGYASTQDTVVGLHALSEFAASLQHDSDTTDNGLSIRLAGDDLDETLNVNENNSLLLQKLNLNQLPNLVEVSATGSGCALVQANIRYNKLPEYIDGEDELFKLKVSANREQNDCAIKTIHICVSFDHHDGYAEGMSVVTVGMVTGWSPVSSSLRKLKSMFVLLEMKKYEIDNKDGSINFYFDKLDSVMRCFDFDVEQNKDLAVSAPKPATVKVYQYYEKDLSAVTSYKLKTICGTKEEISLFDENPNPNPFAQRRIDQNPFQRRVVSDPLVQRRVNVQGEAPAQGVSASSKPTPQIITSSTASLVTSSQPQSTTMAKKVDTSCPKCRNQPPEDLKTLVCNSGSILKVLAGRIGRVAMKLKSDIRPRRKQRIDQFVNVEISEQCDCKLLSPPLKRNRNRRVKRLLIFTNTPNLVDQPGRKEKKLIINSDSFLLNLDIDKSIERRVRSISKRCKMP